MKIMPENTLIGITIDFVDENIRISVEDQGALDDEETKVQFSPVNKLGTGQHPNTDFPIQMRIAMAPYIA